MDRVMDFLGMDEEEESEEERGEEREPSKRAEGKRGRSGVNNVVSFHAPKQTQKGVRVVLSEPRVYEDAQEMADNLKNQRSVVINLQSVPNPTGRRILDFLSGTVYALGGHIQKVGPGIFLCTPANVDVQGTIREMLREN
ncbi:cell division protein SepF [Pasteuria penetrans]|uniref:cell division protein SepF n=1 Tax=Pasteuria penetrans TaxID=86005 RepID=UPI0011EE9CC2|nr:cell division protein SepF [Pasteuria penetrans]